MVLVSSGPAQVAVPDVSAQSDSRSRAPARSGTATRRRHQADLNRAAARHRALAVPRRRAARCAAAKREPRRGEGTPERRGARTSSARRGTRRRRTASARASRRRPSRATSSEAAEAAWCSADPAGGLKAKRGATITITVGELRRRPRRAPRPRRLRSTTHHHDRRRPPPRAGDGHVSATGDAHRRGARGRTLLRARRLARLRARRCATGSRAPGTRSAGSRSPATARWRHEGEPLELCPGRGAARRGRGLPGAARTLRRGRHRAGAAGDARRGLRRRGRGGFGAVHGQGALQGADGPRACRRSTTRGAPRALARAPREVLEEIAELACRYSSSPRTSGSSVGIVKVRDAGAARGGAGAGVRARPAGDRRGDGAGIEVECAVLGLARAARNGAHARLALRAGGDLVRGRVVRLRGEVPPGGMELWCPRASPPRRARGCGSWRWRRSCSRLRGPRARGLLRGRRAGAGQRAEHDARLHPDERLREADRGGGHPLPGAGRSPLPPRAGAPASAAARYSY